ncbi:MAG TPA: protein kinase [Anaerolineales bacterium]|nr:protein kinase [Anaerolineales bacterium]
MELNQGFKLRDRYIIKEKLGKGGMGAVYLAEDTALEQWVAVKANLNPSQQSQRQFEAEARLLAKLRHPHLPLVFDHFIIDDIQYLVMDYIPGEDLSQRLKEEGPQPVYKVLEWADQINAALTYLHSQHPPVIHRDIKPANLKIQPDGKIVLVDFGIAKASEGDTTVGARGYSPGFAPPEQYSDAITGPYSDQYSFAATIYTLLTGSPPPESVDMMLGQKTLRPTRTFSPKIPLHVDTAIQRAMSIEPDKRYTSISQFLTALTDPAALAEDTLKPKPAPEIGEAPDPTMVTPAQAETPDPTMVTPTDAETPGPTMATPAHAETPDPTVAAASTEIQPDPTLSMTTPETAPKKQPNRLPLYIVGVVVVIAAIVGGFMVFGGGTDSGSDEVAVLPNPTQTAAGALEINTQVPSNTPRPNQPDASNTPVPDATFTPAPTEEPTITSTPLPQPTPLGAGGKIAFVSDRDNSGYEQIFVMNSDGSDVTQLTFDETDKSWPMWSPDGRSILYVADGGLGQYNTPLNLEIWVMDADGGNQTNLTQTRGDDEDPVWSPDGSQVVFISRRYGGTRQLMVMNADGSEPRRVSIEFEEYNPTFSPDGQTLMFSSTFFFTLNVRIWDENDHPPEARDLYDLEPALYDNRWNEPDRIGKAIEPAWSPNGDWIVYVRTSGNNRRIYLLDANSNGATVRSLDTLGLNFDPAWSPDSLWIVFCSTRDGNQEIYTMDFGGRFQTNLTNHPGIDKMPSWQSLP